MKVQYTLITLADAAAIYICEQRRRAVRQRGKQVFGLFTTEGLGEGTLCIGDRLRIGSAVLMVTQPRMPCYKLDLRFGCDDMIKRFLMSGRSGFYFSVVREGEVSGRSGVEILSRDPNQVTIADVNRLYFSNESDPELLLRALNVSALPNTLKANLILRAQQRSTLSIGAQASAMPR